MFYKIRGVSVFRMSIELDLYQKKQVFFDWAILFYYRELDLDYRRRTDGRLLDLWASE